MIYTLTLNPALDRELIVPALIENKVLRATQSNVDIGGKGFNVSRMVQALGGQTIALGFVGGRSGAQLDDGLNQMGIRTRFVWLEAESRTNVSIVSNGRYIKANEAGPTVSPEKFAALLEQMAQLAKPGDWWVLAGSLPPGVPTDAYAQMITLLKERGASIFLDASGEPLTLGCQAGPHWVKPNKSEFVSLTGYDGLDEGTAVIRQMGVENIIVSLGEDGAYLNTQHGRWDVQSPLIEEKNPTGAGDAFVGGVVWALADGRSIQEAVCWGAACGTAAASLPGTAMGNKQQIQKLYQKVILKERNQDGYDKR